MVAVAKTNTFTAGTKARASQVNTNFDDMVNALTLRNRDIKVGSLAVGTAATTGSMTISDNDGYHTVLISPVTSSVALTTNFDAANDTVSLSSHGISANQLLSFDTTTHLNNNVYIHKPYFAGNITTNTFKLYSEYSGASAIDILAPSTATGHTLYKGGAIVTLPTLADNQGRQIVVYKNNSAKDLVCVVGENGEKMSGFKAISLYNQDSFLQLVAESTEWKVLSFPYKEVRAPAIFSGNLSLTIHTITMQRVVYNKNQIRVSIYVPYCLRPGNSSNSRIDMSLSNFPKQERYQSDASDISYNYCQVNTTKYVSPTLNDTGDVFRFYQDVNLASFSATSATVGCYSFDKEWRSNYFDNTTGSGELSI